MNSEIQQRDRKYKKNQSELKINTITEIKSILEEINARLEDA